jgi:hypothetical protein
MIASSLLYSVAGLNINGEDLRNIYFSHGISEVVIHLESNISSLIIRLIRHYK